MNGVEIFKCESEVIRMLGDIFGGYPLGHSEKIMKKFFSRWKLYGEKARYK